MASFAHNYLNSDLGVKLGKHLNLSMSFGNNMPSFVTPEGSKECEMVCDGV